MNMGKTKGASLKPGEGLRYQDAGSSDEGQKIYPWNDIRLSNDYTFCKALEDQRFCTRLVSEILGYQVDHVEIIEPHRTVQKSISAKGVQLDVYVKDSDGNVYDFEMQVAAVSDLPRRLRYYSSMLDLEHTERGSHYEEMPDAYVVFFCLRDPFGLGRRRYTFLPQCQEDQSLVMENGQHQILYYCRGTKGDMDREMADFLAYISGTMEPEDAGGSSLTAEADRVVQQLRKDEEWRHGLMIQYFHDLDIKNEAMHKGRAEGRADALERLSRLHEAMKNAGREAEFSEAFSDTSRLDELCREFGIS